MATPNTKPFPVFTQEQADHFWSKVDQRGPDDCWEWTGWTEEFGYGVYSYTGSYLGKRLAHRVAYSLAFGDPGDYMVCHSCDNPPCCNPKCLFLGTRAENSADMQKKGRSTYGEKNPMAKLTAADVVAIREMVANGENQKVIAARFGVRDTCICRIASRKRWKHVP